MPDVGSPEFSGGKSTTARPARRPWRRTKSLSAILGLIYLLPLIIAGCAQLFRGPQEPWSRADRSSAGIAPDPARTPEALVQIYTARTYGWRGVFGVHTWFALKPARATSWERFEVVGFGVNRGRRAVRGGPGVPDGRWYGNNPTLLAELRAQKPKPPLRSCALPPPTIPTKTCTLCGPGRTATHLSPILRVGCRTCVRICQPMQSAKTTPSTEYLRAPPAGLVGSFRLEGSSASQRAPSKALR